MPLISCPTCKREISLNASSCPGCGEPLSNKHQPNIGRIGAASILGWILAGMSLLNLLGELTPLKLIGKLKQWMTAYNDLVNKIGDLFFGWIDFWWINISEQELHLFVVGLVILTARARGAAAFWYTIKNTVKSTLWERINYRLAFYLNAYFQYFLIFASLLVFPAMLLPGQWGFYVGLYLLSSTTFFISKAAKEVNKELEKKRHTGIASYMTPPVFILRELKGVLAVVVLLIVFNYTFDYF